MFGQLKQRILNRPPEELFLLLLGVAAPVSYATWQTLLDNFAIHRASFTGVEIGILQSLREVPGFLAFTVVFLLPFIREQLLLVLSLLVMGIGTALTGFFPSILGLYLTTVLMSAGFHYYYTLQTSLTLQWISKSKTPQVLGRLRSVDSFAAIITFAFLWTMFQHAELDYKWIYLFGGAVTVVLGCLIFFKSPRIDSKIKQHTHLVLRPRYWLYYALTFMSGARRQVIVVFAGFLLVEKFGYSVGQIAFLFMLNSVTTLFLAPKIGELIAKWGERKALVLEYLGLICIFVSYAYVEDAFFAGALYVLDHIFFALAIAINSYFQKIANPADIASTAGVSFTINHIAAVTLPVLLGLLWVKSPSYVFLVGAGFACVSLLLALNVPHKPRPGAEVIHQFKNIKPLVESERPV